jgi:hypothetical protein
MTTRIGHTSRYPRTAAAMRATFIDAQYWKDRLAEVGGPNARLVGITPEGGRMRVQMVQSIAEADLPEQITKVRPGDMIINRAETWGATSGNFDAAVEGAPARFYGAIALAGDDFTCTATISGEVDVQVPLFGSKIEKAIAERLTELFEVEDQFTLNWLAQQS